MRKVHESGHSDCMKVLGASLSALVRSCNGYQNFIDLNYQSYNGNGGDFPKIFFLTARTWDVQKAKKFKVFATKSRVNLGIKVYKA